MTTIQKISFIHILIAAVLIVFVVRLFYLQIIRHSYYTSEAQASQQRQYSIPAERGSLLAYDGNQKVPLVLNERVYRIVADPQIMSDKNVIAQKLSDVLPVSYEEIKNLFDTDLRYVIVAKKQPKGIKDKIEDMMEQGEIQAVFAEATNQRVYPHATLAAQILGYVNDDGEGTYGAEEALDNELAGTPGKIDALTDQNGIPLLASETNFVQDPVEGNDVVLSVDIAMQRQLEKILEEGLKRARSESGSAIIIDPNTGQIKAMASFPSYDPAQFVNVEDPSLFLNPAVSSILEPGSIMKVLTVAAGLDSGSIESGQSYFDPAQYRIDGATIRNVEEDGGPQSRTIVDILKYSLNTGAAWTLMQMGGGELNDIGRDKWYQYMTEKYRLGSVTGIEQGFEEAGLVPDPNEGFGLNIRYANTSFGQGMTATPLQMVAAVSAVVNGGRYFQPTIVSGMINEDGAFNPQQPKLIDRNVVSEKVSSILVDYMQQALLHNSFTRSVAREGYIVGGKTGTAEIANPNGGYYDDRYNGTYVGFVGGTRPEYVIITRVNEPKIDGYAGTRAAAPIFMDSVNMLIDNFAVPSSR